MRLSDANIKGRTVISADGQAIGAIKSLFVNPLDWRVESIGVELHRDIADRLGASRSMFHRGSIEIPVTLIQSIGDAVILGVVVDELREARRRGAEAQPPAPPTP